MTIDEFVKYVERQLRRAKVKLIRGPGRYIRHLEDNSKVGGWYDEENQALAIATGLGKKTWSRLLLHEFCHFLQNKEHSPAWDATFIYRNGAAHDVVADLWAWLAGEDFDKYYIELVIELTKRLELDCERRATRLIKELELPFNLKRYAQQASAYIHFYNILKETRKWSLPGKAPYKIPEITQVMPTTLRGSYLYTPIKIKKLFIKHCY